MIEGLKIQISSVELTKHLRERVDHHTDRQGFYTARAADLTKDKAGDDIEHWDFSNSGRGDPRDSMLTAAKQHAERAAYFAFLADHLIDEVYRLSEQDFRTLEFVSKYG